MNICINLLGHFVISANGKINFGNLKASFNCEKRKTKKKVKK